MNNSFSPAEPLTAIQKAVLLSHMIYANWRTCSSFPGTVRVSQDTGYSERAVINAQKRLCEIGILTLIRKGCRGDGKGRGRQANVYRVNIPAEFVPAKYRTNVNEVHERTATTNMNERPTNVNEKSDQTEPRSPQVSYQVSYKQDNGHAVTGDAPASLSVEEQKLKKAGRSFGLRDSHTDAIIRDRGLLHTAERMALMKQWQPTPEHAAAAFERAGQVLDGTELKKPRLPKDDNQLVAFARQHGLSEARPGEEYFDYRMRLNAELRRKQND